MSRPRAQRAERWVIVQIGAMTFPEGVSPTVHTFELLAWTLGSVLSAAERERVRALYGETYELASKRLTDRMGEIAMAQPFGSAETRRRLTMDTVTELAHEVAGELLEDGTARELAATLLGESRP